MEIVRLGLPRRTMLKVGVAVAALLAVGGGSAWLWRPGMRGRHLTDAGGIVFRAVGRAVLEGRLPEDAASRERALDDFLRSLDALLGALPAASRAELGRLLGLLSVAPGRRWLTGLELDWAQADVMAVATALQSMRTDPSPLRQGAYHALRDLSHAAFYAQPAQWALLGYPGPIPLQVVAHD